MPSFRWPAWASPALCSTVALSMLMGLAAFAPSRTLVETVPAAPVPLHVDLAPVEVRAPRPSPRQAYFEALRERVRWVPARMGQDELRTPDEASRVLLAKSAARMARLHEYGLGFRDVYGLINAESSWVPRDGASRDGTPNLGLAQFEPATAEALGVEDPDDPVEAVHAAAQFMREAAQWSRERIATMDLSPRERARTLREGISVYYNLSWRGRAAWNGRNIDDLPVQTQRHIANARRGAEQAARVEVQLRQDGAQAQVEAFSRPAALGWDS